MISHWILMYPIFRLLPSVIFFLWWMVEFPRWSQLGCTVAAKLISSVMLIFTMTIVMMIMVMLMLLLMMMMMVIFMLIIMLMTLAGERVKGWKGERVKGQRWWWRWSSHIFTIGCRWQWRSWCWWWWCLRWSQCWWYWWWWFLAWWWWWWSW